MVGPRWTICVGPFSWWTPPRKRVGVEEPRKKMRCFTQHRRLDPPFFLLSFENGWCSFSFFFPLREDIWDAPGRIPCHPSLATHMESEGGFTHQDQMDSVLLTALPSPWQVVDFSLWQTPEFYSGFKDIWTIFSDWIESRQEGSWPGRFCSFSLFLLLCIDCYNY